MPSLNVWLGSTTALAVFTVVMSVWQMYLNYRQARVSDQMEVLIDVNKKILSAIGSIAQRSEDNVGQLGDRKSQ